MFIVKFLFSFVISFMILSFPMGNRVLFDHLTGITQPITDKVFSFLKTNAKENLKLGKEITGKLLNNTVPEMEAKKDSIKSTYSATKKIIKKIEDHGENYTDEEKELLKNILEQKK